MRLAKADAPSGATGLTKTPVFFRRTRMRDRILVVSIPKAGTYLMSQTLTELGYSPTHMHIGENAYS